VKEKQIIIFQGAKANWQLVMAAILFTISFFLIASFFVKIEILYLEYLYYAHWMPKLFLLSFILPLAINNSSNTLYSFDLNNMLYKKQFSVGPVRFGKWKKLQSIEYISIYRQSLKNGSEYAYDINLWLKGKVHVTIARYSELFFEEAFKMGYQTAETLKVSYLDSTADYSRDWDWIELDKKLDLLINNHPLSEI